RSLAVSNGRVFFRAPEWGNAPRTTEWASVSSAEVGGNDFSSVLDTQGRTISGDGRYVVFPSAATNFVPAAPIQAVYLRDRLAGTTTCASLNSAGTCVFANATTGPAISADGRFVAFATNADVLGDGPGNDVYVRDLVGHVSERVSTSSLGTRGNGLSIP